MLKCVQMCQSILKAIAQKVFNRYSFAPHSFGIYSVTGGCPSLLSLEWHHMSVTAYWIPTTRLLVPQLVRASNKQNSKNHPNDRQNDWRVTILTIHESVSIPIWRHVFILWVLLWVTTSVITWSQCINSAPPSAAYVRHWSGSALVKIMACRY